MSRKPSKLQRAESAMVAAQRKVLEANGDLVTAVAEWVAASLDDVLAKTSKAQEKQTAEQRALLRRADAVLARYNPSKPNPRHLRLVR